MLGRNEKLKVLHINTNESGGGASDFCRKFVSNNQKYCYLAVGNKEKQNSKAYNLKSFNIEKAIMLIDKILWKLSFKKGFRNSFSFHDKLHFTFYNLRRSKAYREADIIHLHNIHGSYFNFNDLYKILKEKYVVWSMHDMWAFSGGETFFLESKDYKTGEATNQINKYYPLYGPLIDKREFYYKEKKNLYAHFYDKLIFVPGSNWLNNCFKEAFVYNTKINSIVIREGCNSNVFVNYNNRSWDKPRVLIINTGIFYKGTEIFKDFFQKFTNEFTLYIIGNDLDLSFGNLEVIRLKKTQNELAFAKLLNNVDYLIFPSVQDNSPLVVTMALMCGVKIIGSNSSGVKEQMSLCGGLPFEPKSKVKLEKILLSLDLKKDRLNSSKQSKIAAQIYSETEMYNQYLNLYSKITGKDVNLHR